MAEEERCCVICDETIPKKRARRVACVTCSEPCEKKHRRATTSRAARKKRQRAKQPRNVLLKVEQHTANLFKRAVRYTGLSQSAWVGLIVETLLEDEPTARGWRLRQHMTYARSVARGAASIHVRLPVPLWTQVEERAAQDDQQPTPWLSKVCYQASLYAEDWQPTKTVERLKLGYEFLMAHDRHDEARTLKETAFLPRQGVLLRVVAWLEAEHDRQGFRGRLKEDRPRDSLGRLVSKELDEQTRRQWTERKQLEQQIDDVRGERKRIDDGACEWEELNTAFEPYCLLDKDDPTNPAPADEAQYLTDLLTHHKPDACPLSQISAARLKEDSSWKRFFPPGYGQWDWLSDYRKEVRP